MRTTSLEVLSELRRHVEGHLDMPCNCHFALRDPTVHELMDLIDWINEEKGWNNSYRDANEWAALFHTEISEYYEEFRSGHEPDEVYFSNGGKPEGQAVELADELIRIFHWFARHRLSPVTYIFLKERYNMTRPYRHGGKRT